MRPNREWLNAKLDALNVLAKPVWRVVNYCALNARMKPATLPWCVYSGHGELLRRFGSADAVERYLKTLPADFRAVAP